MVWVMWGFLKSGRLHEPVDSGIAIPTRDEASSTRHLQSVPPKNTQADFSNTLPASLTFPAGTFREINFWYEPKDRAVWCMTHQRGVPSFTMALMDELNLLHARIAQYADPVMSGPDAGPLFYVGGSTNRGVFNVGGDLPFFIECIKSQNVEALTTYARACIKLVHEMDFSLGGRVFTICLLEGDALGGGFEAAISFNYLVAERGVKMGLPESLFNAFPGMGAYSHLSRKIGHVKAEKMILSGKVYDAEELYDLGIVDALVDRGNGREAVREFIGAHEKKQKMLLAIGRVRRRINPVSLEELLDVTQIWVENSLNLNAADMRRMELLAKAQARRVAAA